MLGHPSALLCRRDTDTTAWWMTGTRDQLYFYVLHRSTIHGQVKLQKMAGDLQDHVRLCCGASCGKFPACTSSVHRVALVSCVRDDNYDWDSCRTTAISTRASARLVRAFGHCMVFGGTSAGSAKRCSTQSSRMAHERPWHACMYIMHRVIRASCELLPPCECVHEFVGVASCWCADARGVQV